MKAILIMLALVAATVHTAAAADVPRTENGYRLSVPPYAFDFPRDHASHPDFAIEWWYYTGHLDAAERTFGFELTFFRVGLDRNRLDSPSRWALHTLYFAHFALTDVDGRRFHYFQRVSRPALGMSGADTTRYRVWIDDWLAQLEPDGRTHRLIAAEDDIAMDLELVSAKNPVSHGRGGVSQKAEGLGRASHYYSLSRLEGRGEVRVDGRTFPVTALAWMDHEFGSNQLAENQVGWDWFSLQLDDGRELMLYVMRLEDGGIDPYSSGTLVRADGSSVHLPRDAFEITARDHWTSPTSGGVYPSGWTIRIPAHGITLDVAPLLDDQELALPGGITYWEGAVEVTGNAVRGRGYVELTGYAGRIPGF